MDQTYLGCFPAVDGESYPDEPPVEGKHHHTQYIQDSLINESLQLFIINNKCSRATIWNPTSNQRLYEEFISHSHVWKYSNAFLLVTMNTKHIRNMNSLYVVCYICWMVWWFIFIRCWSWVMVLIRQKHCRRMYQVMQGLRLPYCWTQGEYMGHQY